MKTRHLLAAFGLAMAWSTPLFGQESQQYFDGADTICYVPPFTPTVQAICIDFGDDTTSIWQVGAPQKTLFNMAATAPNVLVTDTLNYYPILDTSSFSFNIKSWGSWGILALHWTQKLDMEKRSDYGKVEFSMDAGATWQNAFNNPYVYNFYGFDFNNLDTLSGEDIVFTETDSLWRDLWLCYDMSWLLDDSLDIRFTFISDSVETYQEGWMIDNLLAHITINHTVGEVPLDSYMRVYPNPANDRVNIELQKLQQYHIIERMTLLNAEGRVVDSWEHLPTKFFIDTRKYSSGLYYLNVVTNIKSETVPVLIEHP